ncbi:MAG: Na+/H+ antiporter NhaC family protein [Erysipelotrichaceae bacterium]|nr:Na+/H+ antiporter NhaC family protein [Erysipelotrichaceae bacterium]
MNIINYFLVFLAVLIISLILNINMSIPVGIGVLIFGLAAYKKGLSIKEIYKLAISTVKESMIVVKILLLIGCMTGLWRASGTIAYFVSMGIRIIPESLFILSAFLITTIMSLALGTSFGITATCGVILMTIARAGNANVIITAGAIMSGVYVGDRASYAASSANLVASITKTDIKDNIPKLMKTSIIPVLICIVLYSVFSILNPLTVKDLSLLNIMENEFVQSPFCLIPAVLMLALPFFKVKVSNCMIISIISSIICCLFIQNQSILEIINYMLMGFKPHNPELISTFSGGGLISMLDICLILVLSGSYGGIFEGASLLDQLDKYLFKLKEKTSRFMVMVLISILVCAIFCNQTIGVIMLNLICNNLYSEEEKDIKMLDIESSVIVIAGLVPWCIACSVPLSMLGVGIKAIPYSFFLFLIPIIRLIQSKRHFN